MSRAPGRRLDAAERFSRIGRAAQRLCKEGKTFKEIEAVKRGGSLTIWFDPEMTMDGQPTGKRGRMRQQDSDGRSRTQEPATRPFGEVTSGRSKPPSGTTSAGVRAKFPGAATSRPWRTVAEAQDWPASQIFQPRTGALAPAHRCSVPRIHASQGAGANLGVAARRALTIVNSGGISMGST